MGDEWVPEGILAMTPLWRNFFENTATVQFDHRVLALTTLGSLWTMVATARLGGAGAVWAALPNYTRVAMVAVAGNFAFALVCDVGDVCGVCCAFLHWRKRIDVGKRENIFLPLIVW